MSCPSNFARDAFRLGLDDTLASHVQDCPRCAAWLAEQGRLEVTLPDRWSPAHAKPRPSARRLVRYLLALGLPVAVGTVALILFALPKPPTEVAKGRPVHVQIARLSHGSLSWLSPEDTLLPNDALRFFVRGQDPDDRYVLIGSVDGSRSLARFYPEDPNGCSVRLSAHGDALAGSIVIDQAAGPERVVVVVSHRPLCWPSVGDGVRRVGLGEAPGGDLSKAGVHITRLVFPKRLGARR